VLPAGYVADHAHLTHAATAYGVQGATVAESHTVLSDGLGAAGVYVGMTRGRQTNTLHVVAEDWADAKAQFAQAMGRARDCDPSAKTGRAGQPRHRTRPDGRAQG
jgi:hypothetical protein